MEIRFAGLTSLMIRKGHSINTALKMFKRISAILMFGLSKMAFGPYWLIRHGMVEGSISFENNNTNIPWPPKLPDLPLLDFFLCFFKENLFWSAPSNISELKNKFRELVIILQKEVLQIVLLSSVVVSWNDKRLKVYEISNIFVGILYIP